MLERFTPPARSRRRAGREAINLAQIARELPYQVHDTLEQFRDGQIEVGFVHKGLDEFMHEPTSWPTGSWSRWSSRPA